MACGEVDVPDRYSVPASTEYLVPPEDAGMDVEFLHARPFHVKMAQKVVYTLGNRFTVFKAKREHEDGLNEYVSVYFISSSDRTCIVLARAGASKDEGGRTFLILQYPELLEEIPHLVEQGFEVTHVSGDQMTEDIADHLIPEE